MDELVRKFESVLVQGDTKLAQGDYEGAYQNYLDALLILATAVVYRDTGMLVSPDKLPGFLGAYPQLKEAVERYPLLEVSDETVKAFREDLEKIRGLIEES